MTVVRTGLSNSPGMWASLEDLLQLVGSINLYQYCKMHQLF